MKSTRQASAALLFVLLAAIFAMGCSEDSEESGNYNGNGNYNSASQFYGTYTYSATVGVSTISFTFTSTSWSYYVNGVSTSYSSWEYSNGYIYCYIDGTTASYVLTVISANELSFQGATLTKQ